MPTVLESLKSLIDARITQKTSVNSITPANVGISLKDIADFLKLKVPDTNKTYDLGFLGRDSENNIYICNQQGVNGDLNDRTKWKKLFEEFKYEVEITTNGQTSFILNPIPLNINLVSLYLNGQRLYLSRDFTVSGLGVITYSSTVVLDTYDCLAVEYLGYNT